jgi:hypothetical protein
LLLREIQNLLKLGVELFLSPLQKLIHDWLHSVNKLLVINEVDAIGRLNLLNLLQG